MKNEISFPDSWLKKKGNARLVGRLYPRINAIREAGNSLRKIYDDNFSQIMTYRTFTSYFYRAANAARETGKAITARAAAAAKKDFNGETMTSLRDAFGKIAKSTVGAERIVRELYNLIYKANKIGRFTLWEIYDSVFKASGMTFQTFATYYHRAMKANRATNGSNGRKMDVDPGMSTRREVVGAALETGIGRKIISAITTFIKRWK